jgi:hypothetical protein
MSNKFDKQVDLKGLLQDIKEVEENGGGDFKEVDLGNYKVSIETLELGETKAGDKPMVKAKFKVLQGDFKSSIIFMNQVVTLPFQIKIIKDFLTSLNSSLEIKFESYSQFEKLINNVFETINGNFEYGLEYGENKGFKTFKIIDVFEVK